MIISKEEFSKELSKKIRSLREETGLTLSELSDGCGISAAALGGYEKGRYMPSAYNLYLLTTYFNCSAEELILL